MKEDLRLFRNPQYLKGFNILSNLIFYGSGISVRWSRIHFNKRTFCCSFIFIDSSQNVSLDVASLDTFWIIFLFLNEYDTLALPIALLSVISISIGIEKGGPFSLFYI